MHATIIRIRVRASFPAAHRIRIDAAGTREPIHVHHWRVSALLEPTGDPLASAQQARAVIGEWTRRHRGRCINELPPFDVLNPTAEEVARHLAHLVASELPDNGLVELTVGEAVGFSATYRPVITRPS